MRIKKTGFDKYLDQKLKDPNFKQDYQKELEKLKQKWHVYILRCSNDAYYTGITKDISARLKKHKEGKGSKYVRSHLPFKFILSLCTIREVKY